jgi:hypothetical protein
VPEPVAAVVASQASMNSAQGSLPELA